MLLSLFAYRPRQLNKLWHLESDLFLDDLEQGYIRRSHIAGLCHQGAA